MVGNPAARRRVRTLVSTGIAVLMLATNLPPAHAAGSIYGGGVAAGTVGFSSGVPPLAAGCAPTSFTFASDTRGGRLGATAGTLVNTIGVEYAGPMEIWGSGGSPCELATGGNGSLTVYATGVNVLGSTVGCGPLQGTYLREGTTVVISVAGQCRINTVATEGGVTFSATGEFAPTAPGQGVTSPVTSAAFAVEFHVLAS